MIHLSDEMRTERDILHVFSMFWIIKGRLIGIVSQITLRFIPVFDFLNYLHQT